VVTLDLAPITEPALISSLLGTPQGYVGHGAVLPIHRLAQQPFCVVRFLSLGTCHPVARTVVAQAIRDGYLTDGTGRRVFLSSAVLVLEARGAGGPGAGSASVRGPRLPSRDLFPLGRRLPGRLKRQSRSSVRSSAASATSCCANSPSATASPASS
jgi:hypothetical protein